MPLLNRLHGRRRGLVRCQGEVALSLYTYGCRCGDPLRPPRDYRGPYLTLHNMGWRPTIPLAPLSARQVTVQAGRSPMTGPDNGTWGPRIQGNDLPRFSTTQVATTVQH